MSSRLTYTLCSTETTGLWGLVNNAGILDIRPIEWASLDIFKRLADVNLWGMIDVTKIFLPSVKEARGRVVNFSSAAGKRGIHLIVAKFLKSISFGSELT